LIELRGVAEVGIAESDLVGIAAGLACCGKRSWLSSFACFVMCNAYDQLRMSVAFPQLDVKVVGTHAGISIGEDGPSQMGLEDLAMMRAQPNFTVFYPCDAVSTERLMAVAASRPGPAYIRTSRPKTPVIYGNDEPFPIGGAKVVRQNAGDKVTVVAAGVTLFEALKAADKLKTDFVHHVSYELRSPLTNIIGFAHFLGDPVTGPLMDKQREYLSYITVSTNALLAIINNILDLASIDAGAMTLNLGPVDIRKTMEAAAEGVQDRLVKSGITLEIHAPPEIGSFIADERRVRQSLFNLLANAVGFSPLGEIITFAAQRRRDAIAFSVTDRGPGIPAEVQNKVFDWFETHSLGSRHRGTGLGLSLVRSFVELHGGSVTLESTVGRGTTVTCVFPLAQTAEQSAA